MRTDTGSHVDCALMQVEVMLEELASSDVSLLSDASAYIVKSGGKRLRPRVLLLAFEAVGGSDFSQIIPVAAAVELIHTASLVHDDINDGGKTRRGQATINARWGNTLALLTGDFIFLRVFNLLADFGSDVVRVLAKACIALVEGETLQTFSQDMGQVTEEDYLGVVGRKTGSLFSACSELGAVLAGSTAKQRIALSEFGYNLGVAFQIRDDVLDLAGNSDRMGKPVARDLEQQKMSLATLYALEASAGTRAIFLRKDHAEILRVLEETGAIEYAMQRSNEFSALAKKQLSVLPEAPAQAALLLLADYAVNREE